MNTTSKTLLKASSFIAVGVVVINAIIYWCNTGFGFSCDILTLSVPMIVFTWLASVLCGIAMRLTGGQGAVVSVAALVALHAAALIYFLYALTSWREGTEFAQLFIIQLLFALIVLCLAVLRPVMKARQQGQADHPISKPSRYEPET